MVDGIDLKWMITWDMNDGKCVEKSEKCYAFHWGIFLDIVWKCMEIMEQRESCAVRFILICVCIVRCSVAWVCKCLLKIPN